LIFLLKKKIIFIFQFLNNLNDFDIDLISDFNLGSTSDLNIGSKYKLKYIKYKYKYLLLKKN
jgi:hypothetical protein